jgi:hypothetical protein
MGAACSCLRAQEAAADAGGAAMHPASRKAAGSAYAATAAGKQQAAADRESAPGESIPAAHDIAELEAQVRAGCYRDGTDRACMCAACMGFEEAGG